MIPLLGYPSGATLALGCRIFLRSTEDLAEEGAMLSVADWPLGDIGGDMEISWWGLNHQPRFVEISWEKLRYNRYNQENIYDLLVVSTIWMMTFPIILGIIIIPTVTQSIIFQRGRPTTRFQAVSDGINPRRSRCINWCVTSKYV